MTGFYMITVSVMKGLISFFIMQRDYEGYDKSDLSDF